MKMKECVNFLAQQRLFAVEKITEATNNEVVICMTVTIINGRREGKIILKNSQEFNFKSF